MLKALNPKNSTIMCDTRSRSQMSWKTLESPGSNLRHLADRKILRFINSAKSSTTKRMVHWWILGACLSNQRRKPQRMLIMDTSEGMLIVWRSSTLQHFRRPGDGGACRRDRTWTRSCQTRTPTFFFGPRKGGFVRTLRTPLGYVPDRL